MLHNTSATATFNGWRSASFPERSGVQQGSPLSPLLYVIAAQPLASHLRRQSQVGVIRPITMPDGQPAPVSHQHADDTSLQVLQPKNAQTAIVTSIGLFCAAFFFFFFLGGRDIHYKDAMKETTSVCEGHPQQKLQATRTT